MNDRATSAAFTPFTLPENFLLGTATSGLQAEGGDQRNSWYAWAEQGRISDGSSPIVANDHWNRVEEDTRLLKELGVHTHRMGIEWARIEPDPGRYDSDAIHHYRHEIGLLREAGIEPLVTLHHFSNPVWLEEAGGWLRSEVIDRFDNYVARVVTDLGDLVSDWITINEPNVYLAEGYVFGEWPPGRQKPIDYLRGSRIMIAAHERAYRTIHRIQAGAGRSARVGVAHHIRVFEPGPRPGSKLIAALYDRLFHRRFLDPMSEYSDFLGINYYTRDIVTVTVNPGQLFGSRSLPRDALTSDLDWEIFPEGLYAVVLELYDRYDLPVFITENGICDGSDRKRAPFIYGHLLQVRRLLDRGVPVERYYHWTLMDNFEWALGESAPFGLYKCDFRSQARTLRTSGHFYRDLCGARGVTPELIAAYLDPPAATR